MTRYPIEYSLVDAKDSDGVSGSCYKVGYMSGFSLGGSDSSMGSVEDILIRKLWGSHVYLGVVSLSYFLELSG